jgi:hypothetical protein
MTQEPLIGALMTPVSRVSCVSSCYWVNAAETYETFHWESGMRYDFVTNGSLPERYNILWISPKRTSAGLCSVPVP